MPSHPTNSKQCQIVKGLVPVSLTCDVFGRPSNQRPGKAHRLVISQFAVSSQFAVFPGEGRLDSSGLAA